MSAAPIPSHDREHAAYDADRTELPAAMPARYRTSDEIRDRARRPPPEELASGCRELSASPAGPAQRLRPTPRVFRAAVHLFPLSFEG
jgi:hypothetical protein